MDPSDEVCDDVRRSDRALRAALIATPGYAHDYASPFDAAAVAVPSEVHGRWWLTSIHPESFKAVAAADAKATLQAWADEQEWTEPDFRQPPEVQARLQEVYALLETGTLYELVNPGSSNVHEYGDVTGRLGFHEFIVLDRATRHVHVVVASGD